MRGLSRAKLIEKIGMMEAAIKQMDEIFDAKGERIRELEQLEEHLYAQVADLDKLRDFQQRDHTTALREQEQAYTQAIQILAGVVSEDISTVDVVAILAALAGRNPRILVDMTRNAIGNQFFKQPQSTSFEQQVLDVWDRENKIQAIKFYRSEKKVGLKEAKDAVEAIRTKHTQTYPRASGY